MSDKDYFHIGLWNYARDYYRAAVIVKSNIRSQGYAPIYYLFLHSIELAFKAFLYHRGHDEKKLRSLGHDLKRIYEECRENGISKTDVTDEIEYVIKLASEHCKGKEFEYIREGLKTYPTIDRLHKVADKCLNITGVEIGVPSAQLKKIYC